MSSPSHRQFCHQENRNVLTLLERFRHTAHQIMGLKREIPWLGSSKIVNSIVENALKA